MNARLAEAIGLSLGLGSVAVFINLGAASAQALPYGVRLMLPLVSLGLAPLPGVLWARPKQRHAALLAAAGLQVAAIIGAASAAAVTTGPSFMNSLAYVGLYGFFAFCAVTIPVIALLRRTFVAK
jgi:hypothetical protein